MSKKNVTTSLKNLMDVLVPRYSADIYISVKRDGTYFDDTTYVIVIKPWDKNVFTKIKVTGFEIRNTQTQDIVLEKIDRAMKTLGGK